MPWEGAGDAGRRNSVRGIPTAQLLSTLDASGTPKGAPRSPPTLSFIPAQGSLVSGCRLCLLGPGHP